MNHTIRILIAKPGLDGHDLGAKLVARSLRDAGYEVIYLGLQQTPEQIINSALQEDVELIGCSMLSGSHLGWMRKIMEGLQQAGLDGIQVIVGGTIPKSDISTLKEMGVREVFPTGTPLEDILTFIHDNIGSAKKLSR